MIINSAHNKPSYVTPEHSAANSKNTNSLTDNSKSNWLQCFECLKISGTAGLHKCFSMSHVIGGGLTKKPIYYCNNNNNCVKSHFSAHHSGD